MKDERERTNQSMSNYLVLDVEATTKNKGHPFTSENKLCLIGYRRMMAGYKEPLERTLKIQHDEEPYGQNLKILQEEIDDDSPILVGFNFKYDLHWLRRYGIRWDLNRRVHDCQLAYFLLTNQSHDYPSLNEVAAHYGLGQKDAFINEEYWGKGVDTTDIPWDVLDRYNRQDLFLTEQIYHRQIDELDRNPKLQRLFRLQCQDLLVLEEMEWNGLKYDVEKSRQRAQEVNARCAAIIESLNEIIGISCCNWNSVDHVSSVLYGGTIDEVVKERYQFFYKDPKREPVWKERNKVITHLLPRLVEPLPNTSLAKEGKWQTGGPILKELKGAPTTSSSALRIIELLLELAEFTKLNDYYKGIPDLIEEMGWEDNTIHGNLNQCSVVTGRLSSNKPNLQNIPEVVHECIQSRFGA